MYESSRSRIDQLHQDKSFDFWEVKCWSYDVILRTDTKKLTNFSKMKSLSLIADWLV